MKLKKWRTEIYPCYSASVRSQDACNLHLIRWPESFLTTKACSIVRKKVELSKKAWGETPKA